MAVRMQHARLKLAQIRGDGRLPIELIVALDGINEDLLIGIQWALQAGAPIMPEGM